MITIFTVNEANSCWVKVINNESLYIERSREVGGKPADVIHVWARASSQTQRGFINEGFLEPLAVIALPASTKVQSTDKKKTQAQWSFASKQHSLGMQI